jgi:hypothetical protein
VTLAPDRLAEAWIRLWLAAAAGSLAALTAQYPLFRHALRSALAPLASPEQVEQAWLLAQTWLVLGGLFSPLVVLAKAALVAGILCLVSTTLGRPIAFRGLLGLVLCASLCLVLETWCGLTLLHLQGLESISGPADLKAKLGLDLLLAPSAPWAVVLGQINPFQLAYGCILAVGLASSGRLTRGQAVAVVGAVWLAGAILVERFQAWSNAYADLVS